ncbi:MAG: Mur ligase family protein [Candidatus Pacebacteria bacterium]|nr:Mur ligase family protein [Candidatus Paceibacterota bacterium]
MPVFLNIIGLLLFIKLFLFWLWLWQLKEYHIGRFLAHFETQAITKIISSFWRIKLPKFTGKTAVIFISEIIAATALSLYFKFAILFLILFAPVFSSAIVLLFQIPTVFLRNRIIKKAKIKIRQFPNLLVIGITGSYGKTSTKEFLYSILSEKFKNKVLKTKEHQNSEIGISQCILADLEQEHEIFIVEMGAYNRGGIKMLCDIVRPKIGILTGINEQHMSTFGSLENIIKGKYELIESLPADGVAFFNAKNKYCLELYNETLRRLPVKAILYGQNATFFGEENILGAMAAAKELGMADAEIKAAVDRIENKMPGIKIKEGIGGLKIIDATYSANPDGVIANLEYLKNNFSGKKIIVMPCLIELGKASKEVHTRIGKKIGEVCDLAIITTKDYFKEIKEAAFASAIAEAMAGKEATASQRKPEILFLENPKEIFAKIMGVVKEGDAVLLESRVPKEVVEQLTGSS